MGGKGVETSILVQVEVDLANLMTMNRLSIVDKKKKQSGSQGQPQPVAVVLLGDDYTPANETFYLRQEIQVNTMD